MNKTILVAYASRLGSTKEVAEAVAQQLRDRDETVHVRCVEDVTDLSQYDAVVVGSAIQRDAWLPEAVAFVEQNRAVLSKVPVAYFVVCMTMCEDTKENRQQVISYIKPVIEMVKPVGIGLFGGVIDYTKFSWLMQLAMMEDKIPEGDFRNWDAIYEWADEVETEISNR